MDNIYKILESLDKVSENKESGVKVTNIKWKAEPGVDLPSSVKLNISAPIGTDEDKIWELVGDKLEDDYGYTVVDYDMQFEESIEEGQYDGKSREELLKMKAEAEASIKNMKSSGSDPQSKFYDETQMMMAQQHLDFINDALKKVGESVEEAIGDITPIDHSDDEEGGASVEDIESAITRRMMNHPKFGALIREIDIIDLNDAIEDVARFHEGGDLGSSDVSAMVNDVLKQLNKEGALSEAEVNEEEVEENAFNQAAAAAARAGKKEFEFGGKTHPVKMDKATAHKLDDDINEDEDSMPASPDEGGMAGDQIEFIKYAADEIKDHIEAGGDFPEWFQNKMSDVYGKMKDLHGYMEGDKRNDETEDEVEFELEERKLSSSEEKEMERIVTAMKDDPETVKDMKERYGKRWEEVAYATATKMAKQHGKGTGKKKKKTESTVAGAVAVGADATGSSIYGNPSVYESMNSQVENMITESMSVNVSSSTEGEPSVSVSATGDDALALAQLLQLAKVERPMGPCPQCGEVHEGSCMNEENEANSANNTHTYDMHYLLNAISGGLNGQKKQVNPNNPGDNPLAMTGIGKDTLNLGESEEDTSVSHLEALYKEFKAK